MTVRGETCHVGARSADDAANVFVSDVLPSLPKRSGVDVRGDDNL